MIIGKLWQIMRRLEHGEEIVITYDDLSDQAQYDLTSNLETVRRVHIKRIVDEINSNEYPYHRILERYDYGDWVLKKIKPRGAKQ